MKKLFPVIEFVLMLFLSSSLSFAVQDPGSAGSMNLKKKVFGLQIPFIENHGQVKDRSVRFYADIFAGTVFVTDKGEMVYGLTKPGVGRQRSDVGKQQEDSRRITALSERLESSKQTNIRGVNKSETRVNYFIGDRDNWKTGLETWQEVSLGEVYDGVDLRLRAYGHNVEKIFTVRPEGSVSDIRLRIDGAKGLRVNESGELEVETADGTVGFSRPTAYQETDGKRVEIAYVASGDGYGFKVGDYDPTKPLIIDPVLSYSTYFGSTGSDYVWKMAVDLEGNVYVTGWTNSAEFPVTNGAYGLQNNGGTDVFVSKFNSDGSALIYSTYIGGSAGDQGMGIAVDSSQNAYVTGYTSSTNFPVQNALDPVPNSWDAFVLKLNPEGSALVYSTYLGGSGSEEAWGIAVDAAGNAYVTGHTGSTNFPIQNPIQSSMSGTPDVFVTKINPEGSALVYSTYLGGTHSDYATGIAVDSSQNAYITGYTDSTDFRLQNAFQPAKGSGKDAFVTKINSEGSALVYSTYLGGNSEDKGAEIAADPSGNAYVAGRTTSTNFPVHNPIKDRIPNAAFYDAFVTKINPEGSALTYSTYLGGSNHDGALGIALDSAGNAYIAGYTHSADFPILNPVQALLAGTVDGFITKLNSAGSGFEYSTYLGGGNTDSCHDVAVDGSGNAYVIGLTDSGDFPTTPGALRRTYDGAGDSFVAKIVEAKTDLSVVKTDNPDPVPAGEHLTYTITVTNNGPDTATNVTATDTLPENCTFISAVSSQGTCSEYCGVVTCQIGELALDASATLTIVVIPVSQGVIYNTAAAAGNEGDTNPANNSVTIPTVVALATSAPDISVFPLSHDFGSISVGGMSASQTILITNEGDSPLDIGVITIAGPDASDFILQNDTCSGQVIPVSGRATVDVVFVPVSPGPKTAFISISSNDPDEPGHQVGLTGGDYTSHLHSRTFTPTTGISAETRDSIINSGTARAHVLVQTDRIPNTTEVSELRTMGLRLLIYIPNQLFFASLPTDASSLDMIAAHPVIRSVIQILPGDRVSGNIKDGIDDRLKYPDGSVALEVRVYPDVTMADGRQVIASIASEILNESERMRLFLVRIAPQAIDALSQLDYVQFITEVAPPGEDDNDQARVVTGVSNVQIIEDTLDGAGNVNGIQAGSPYALDGKGVIVGQWENLHPDCSHPDFAGFLDSTGAVTGTDLRVTFGDGAMDCTNPSYIAGNDTTIGDHATHVAGIVLGNGSESAGAGGLVAQWRGMAPNASIISFIRPVLDTDNDTISEAGPVADLNAQYVTAIAGGMALSTNSWGYEHCHRMAGTSYELASELYDEIITDRMNPGQGNAIEIIASAGNCGPSSTLVDRCETVRGGGVWPDTGTVRVPNSAKNSIVVGNVFSNNNNELSGTSSRGPVDDGRLKPELVAPGDEDGPGLSIRSTVMTINTDDTGNPGAQGSGCSSDGIGGDGTDDCAFPYDDLSGTSMSTPVVTGAAALIIEQFRSRGAEPWPSTIKALLVHTAVDLCCDDSQNIDNDTSGPDYSVGYGLINVRAAIDLVRDNRNAHIVQSAGFSGWGSCTDNAGAVCDYDTDGAADDHIYTVNLPAGLPRYRVTLAYDDLPGAGGLLARGASALWNDLDLFLIAPDGSVMRPWVLDPDNPTAPATTGVDNLNPLEVVDVQNPAGGQWRIVVRPGRLMPFELDPPQRYTLIYETYEPDIMIRDHAADDGGVPSSRHEAGSGWTPLRPWTSPDIIMEGGEIINPGVQEFVQAAVTNKGRSTVNDIAVRLYWANYGIGLDYSDYLEHEMGSCEIASLEPGERSNPADCRIPYTWIAADLLIGEDGKAHVCFLATVEAPADGLTFEGDATVPEDANPRKFYVWDNNMASQNIRHELLYPGGDDGVFDFEIRNPEPETALIQVEQDTTGLPQGWNVQVTPASSFTLPPHGRTFARVQIIPPPGAPPGSSGHVSLYGKNSLNGRILTGFEAVARISLHVDTDGDGVPDEVEDMTCMDSMDSDTDDDGLSDGVEDVNRNSVVDPGETDPCDPDTDDDRIQDGTELGMTTGVPDPDGDGPLLGTDLTIFIPDSDPTTKTDPLKADTDGDGCLDGVEVLGGRNPLQADPQGDLNGDCALNLGDAIFALDLMTGIGPSGNLHPEGDVNGDGKIGTEEVIWILQKVSGLR